MAGKQGWLQGAKETLTYREIGEQAEAVSAAQRLAAANVEWAKRYVGADVEQAIFSGSGSSYYQAQTMASTYRSWLQRPAVALPSSDLLLVREQSVVVGRPTVVFGVSRSGESTEVVLALRSVQDLPGWILAGITCHEDSTMAGLADCAVSALGKERSTVMTKSLTSMIMAMQTSVALVSGREGLLNELGRTADALGAVVRAADVAAPGIVQAHDFNKTIFLGLGGLFGLAQEGSLKLKEMANVWTESFGTLEFRHGPKSVIDRGSCIVLLLSETTRAAELKVAAEMKEYGAYVVVVTACAGHDTAFADEVFEVGLQDISDEARSVAYMPLLHYLGMYTSLKKGLNPDQPRNLTQIVRI